MNSSNTAGAPASRLVSRSATSDGGRASRLRSPAVAISHGPDLGRRYFDGGCSMPATSAVEPVLPVEGAAPVSAVEHVRPSTGRANERTALPDVPVGQGGTLLGPPEPYFARSTGATELAAITDDAEAATAGEGKGSACAKPGQPPFPANLSLAQTVAAIVGWAGER